jgi:hypothetical protein
MMTTTEREKQMTTRATTIDDAYRACNPDQPLPPDDDRYVDLSASRGMRQIAGLITWKIQNSGTAAQTKRLFTGHRGSGKTTELLRLQRELERNAFFTIYLDTEKLLDLGNLNYLDVLVAIAEQTEETLRDKGIPLPDILLEDISRWFSDHIVEESQVSELQGTVETSAEAGATIPFLAKLLARVTANFKTGSTHRETIRTQLNRNLSVFIEKLNLLIGTARNAVQQQGFTDLVLIVDGMEKMRYELHKDGESTHSEMFVRHAEQLCAPECHIIYTVPVSLPYQRNLMTDFEITVLPMVRMDEEGIARLVEIIERRVDTATLFTGPELIVTLAHTSGGAVRDLMHLMRMAMEASTGPVGAADVKRAISDLRKIYTRLIRESDLALFQQIARTRLIQGGDEPSGRLLDLRLVLEYQNGDLWADLHPVVREIPWIKEALASNAA